MSSSIFRLLKLTAPLAVAGLVLLLGCAGVRAQTLDYRLDVLAPTRVFPGQNLYAQVTPVYTSGSTAYISATSVVMNGVDVLAQVLDCSGHVECPKNTAGNYFWNSGQSALFRLQIPASTPPGTYTAVMLTDSGGVVRTSSLAVEVLAPPAPLSTDPLPTPPAIPTFAKWESTMLTLARKWCPAPGTVLGLGDEQAVWYYDGGRTYFQIADYTQDRSWETCAFEVAHQYRDAVIVANGGISRPPCVHSRASAGL